jgi:hypothetical protein
MRRMRSQPAISQVPTLDGDPPSLEVQEKVVDNQVQSSRAWNDTAQDIVLNNIINENEEVRDTRWQIIAVVMVVLALFLYGSWWTYNAYAHDRFVAHERAAGERTPYTPETIR